MDVAARDFVWRDTMRRYAAVRTAVIATVMAVAYLAWSLLGIDLPLPQLSSILLAMVVVNALLYVRARHPWPFRDGEVFWHVLTDVVGLTALLYYTGGAQNPFAYCYLLLVLFAASTLPRPFGWTLAGICVLSYSVLRVHYVALPLPDSMSTHEELDDLSRWVMYVMLAGLVVWFALRLNELRVRHERHLQDEALEAARQRYVHGLATQAAGTLHELGTPLSTMRVILGDLRRSDTPPPDWNETVEVLWQQVELCRRTLAELASATEPEQLSRAREVSARGYLEGLAERFHVTRPQVPLRVRLDPWESGVSIPSDLTLQQSLLGLMGNAADASPNDVELRARLEQDALHVEILDRGPGVAPRLRERLARGELRAGGDEREGELRVAHSAIERLGGSVHLLEREDGGTCLRVVLPALKPDSIGQEVPKGGSLAIG